MPEFEYHYFAAEITRDNVHEMIVWAKNTKYLDLRNMYDEMIDAEKDSTKIYLVAYGRVLIYVAWLNTFEIMRHDDLVAEYRFKKQGRKLQNEDFKEIEKIEGES